MLGSVPSVSTLFMIVGQSNKPDIAGNGGLERGAPLFPSIDAISAVSSPHTNAPAPSFIETSKLNLEPRIFFPRSPYSFIWFIAFFSLSIASGYSALI
ncbi:MAG: hypothetical protein ILNGONEN_00387 [Syntrophorhabdaceae bacterium]|nr:hypothetical protein [Syntrophorhabdaceae bacterium]